MKNKIILNALQTLGLMVLMVGGEAFSGPKTIKEARDALNPTSRNSMRFEKGMTINDFQKLFENDDNAKFVNALVRPVDFTPTYVEVIQHFIGTGAFEGKNYTQIMSIVEPRVASLLKVKDTKKLETLKDIKKLQTLKEAKEALNPTPRNSMHFEKGMTIDDFQKLFENDDNAKFVNALVRPVDFTPTYVEVIQHFIGTGAFEGKNYTQIMSIVEPIVNSLLQSTLAASNTAKNQQNPKK
jgi:hypothetical protein